MDWRMARKSLGTEGFARQESDVKTSDFCAPQLCKRLKMSGRYDHTRGEHRLAGLPVAEFVCPPFAELNGTQESAKSPLWKRQTKSSKFKRTTQWETSHYISSRPDAKESIIYDTLQSTVCEIVTDRSRVFTPVAGGRNDMFIRQMNETNKFAYQIVSISWRPLYKVIPVKNGNRTRRSMGDIAGVLVTRRICGNPTKRQEFPEHTNEATEYTADEYDEAIRAHYNRVAFKHKPEQPDPLKQWYVKQTEDGYARIDTETEDFEMPWVSGQFTENQIFNNDRRTKRPKTFERPIDFLGISCDKVWKHPNERKYWIGRAYNHNANLASGEKNVAQIFADYFGIHRDTVFEYAKFAANAKGYVIPGTKIRVKRVKKLEGEWNLKFHKKRKYIKPWTTCDGMRIMGTWIVPGPMDMAYIKRSQSL